MEMQENMAELIRLAMEKKHMSLQEFSKELEISRTMLQAYLRGKGNPSLKTIIHLAEKLDLDPAVFLTGMGDLEHPRIVLLLLDTVQGIAELSDARKQRFAELFLDMVKLWSEE